MLDLSGALLGMMEGKERRVQATQVSERLGEGKERQVTKHVTPVGSLHATLHRAVYSE